jgi:C4-dicarboxylate transporter DctM subunit
MALLVVILFACIIIGVPISFSLGAASLVRVLNIDIPLTVVPQRLFVSLDIFVLLSIPLFILAGLVMNEGGLTQRLVKLSQLIIGRIPGGLAHVNVVTSMFFGGISGAAVADASAIGAIMIPAMKEDGYSPEFSAAVTAASSTVGPIIPPSIPMLVLGVISGVSIGALFLAGAIPGILIGLGMIGLNMVLLRKRFGAIKKTGIQKITFQEAIITIKDGVLAIIMPLIIVGGIVFGVFTPTESAVVAVIYSFFIGGFIYRKIELRRIPHLLLRSAILSSAVMFVIAAAGLLAWLIAFAQIPQMIANLFLAITSNKNVFLFLVAILLIFIGFFMGPTPALIILAPVLMPAALSYDLQIVHFGAFIVIGLVIGLITPPVGSVLFITCGIAKISLLRLTRAIIPFLLFEIAILLLVAYIPSLSLWLPKILKAI